MVNNNVVNEKLQQNLLWGMPSILFDESYQELWNNAYGFLQLQSGNVTIDPDKL